MNANEREAKRMEKMLTEQARKSGIRLGRGGIQVTVEGNGTGYKEEKGNITEI